MPEQKQAKDNDDQACDDGAKEIVGRLRQTPAIRDLAFAAFHRMGPAGVARHRRAARRPSERERTESNAYSTTGLPSVMTRTFSSMPCARADASNRCGGSWSGSNPRGKVP